MSIITNKTILLASKSPRRRELIKSIGLNYKIVEADVEEIIPPNIPVEHAPEYLAKLKSNIPIELTESEILLTADTDVIFNHQVLGKPTSIAHAKEMLCQLSGQSHQVISGVCLRTPHKTTTFSVCTTIHFYELSKTEIDYYVNHYEVMDKAGAYAIQEWIGLVGIKSIEGDYYNVVGLPIAKLLQELKKM